MTRYTIGISPGKLTGIAIYDSEENNLMTYVDFEDRDLEKEFLVNRLNEIRWEADFWFDVIPPQDWWEFCTAYGIQPSINLEKVWPSPSDICAETGIRLSNQPLANAVTMAMEKMKV